MLCHSRGETNEQRKGKEEIRDSPFWRFSEKPARTGDKQACRDKPKESDHANDIRFH